MTHNFPDTHHDVSSNTIFGFWLYLMTDCVMFASFFAAYAVLNTGMGGPPSPAQVFDLPFALTESMVLLASSFTCGIAMLPHHDKKRMLFWFALTFLLGIVFMILQGVEFNRLISQGFTWQTNAFLSSYFTLVGLHGLHILIGLLVMILFMVQLIRWGFTGMVLRRLTCLRMYWQFLYLIWIFTFAIVYLMGAK